jgi:hypothetical protein
MFLKINAVVLLKDIPESNVHVFTKDCVRTLKQVYSIFSWRIDSLHFKEDINA